jgi:hypothetical protein
MRVTSFAFVRTDWLVVPDFSAEAEAPSIAAVAVCVAAATAAIWEAISCVAAPCCSTAPDIRVAT